MATIELGTFLVFAIVPFLALLVMRGLKSWGWAGMVLGGMLGFVGFAMISGMALLMFFEYDVVVSAEIPVIANTTSIASGNVTYTYSNIYTPTTNINATSSGTDNVMSVTTGTGALTVRSGSTTLVTELAANSASLLENKSFNQVTMSLSKTGSPTGTATIGSYYSLNSNVVDQCATQDVALLTGSQADYTYNCATILRIASGTSPDRIGLKYTGGDAANLVNVFNDPANPFDGVNSDRVSFTSSWQAPVTTSDLRMALNMVTTPSYMRDGNGLSYWVNNSNSEAPLCVSADIGGVNVVNGVRLTHEDLARIPNSLSYYTSSDASTWTFREAINLDQTETERVTYLLTEDYTFRYHRLCVDEYGTGVQRWQVNALDYVLADATQASNIVSYDYSMIEETTPIINSDHNTIGWVLFALALLMAIVSVKVVFVP